MYSSSKSDFSKKPEVNDIVSVIIPAYNPGERIIDALDSVRDQYYRPIEIIVVDDGSIDPLKRIVSKWSSANSDRKFRLKYIRQLNRGPGAARNTGFRAASGFFVQFLDSDDLIHPEKISRSIQELRRTNADIAVCQVYRFEEQKDLETRLREAPLFAKFTYVPISPPYIARIRWDSHIPLYRRSVIEETGPYNEAIKITENFEWVSRCRCLVRPTCFLPYELYFYRQNVPGSLTSQSFRDLARNRLRTTLCIAKTLKRHKIQEPREWQELGTYALKTSYRARRLGLEGVAKLNYLLAQKLSKKAGLPFSLILRFPWAIARILMAARQIAKRVLVVR